MMKKLALLTLALVIAASTVAVAGVHTVAGPSTGANTICLSVAAYQENCAASSLFIEYRKVPSLARIEKLVKLAHDRGMRVILMPIILLENPGEGEWRGKIAPRRNTGTTARYQRLLSVAIKRARHLAMLPFVREYYR